jgi:hypothetical protein
VDARDDDEPLNAVNRATELEAGFAGLEAAFAAIAEELEQTVQPAQELGEQIRENLAPLATIGERVERSFAPLQELARSFAPLRQLRAPACPYLVVHGHRGRAPRLATRRCRATRSTRTGPGRKPSDDEPDPGRSGGHRSVPREGGAAA